MLLAQAFSVGAIGQLLIVAIVVAVLWYIFSLMAPRLNIPPVAINIIGAIALAVLAVFAIRFVIGLL